VALDSLTERQLMEARDKIMAQLDDIEFRVTAKGFSRRGGPPDYRDVYAELQSELREINELLEPDEEGKIDQSKDQAS
jgi:hypothetical protein